MKRLLSILKKQGGLNLIKQYVKSGAFFSAVSIFFILGKSATALELLRAGASLKTKQYLLRKYRRTLKRFDDEYCDCTYHSNSNKVWVCWLQGIDNAPPVVKKCYESLKRNLPSKEIVLISEDNLDQYVIFPKYIMEKWTAGVISHTHMTDLLRLELLIKYGGTWIDSTVWCSQNEECIPDYFFKSDLFFFQCLKPGRDGHSTVMSSWYINAASNNKILLATRYLLYEYWKKNNELLDYFLLHDFFQIVLEYYSMEWKKVIPVCNSTPHILLLRMFDEYDEEMFRYIISQTPFHKLSYKFSDEQMSIPNTFYYHLMVTMDSKE